MGEEFDLREKAPTAPGQQSRAFLPWRSLGRLPSYQAGNHCPHVGQLSSTWGEIHRAARRQRRGMPAKTAGWHGGSRDGAGCSVVRWEGVWWKGDLERPRPRRHLESSVLRLHVLHHASFCLSYPEAQATIHWLISLPVFFIFSVMTEW